MRLAGKGNFISNFEGISVSAKIDNSRFEEGVRVAGGASLTGAKVGRFSSVGRGSKVSHCEIGNFCAISWDCTVNAVFHPLDHASVNAFPYAPEMGGFVSSRKQEHRVVRLGNDVWLGANAIIMPGITIGDGAVVGAGSIVTRDVGPYQIVAGNPARRLRDRFEPEIVDELLEIRWWDWPVRALKMHVALFQEPISRSVVDKLKRVGKSIRD